MNSKLRASSTKNSQNYKNIAFHAGEPINCTMARSPMKTRITPQTFAVLQADILKCFCGVAENPAEVKNALPQEVVS